MFFPNLSQLWMAMSNDDPQHISNNSNASQNATPSQRQPNSQKRGLFSIPAPVKRIFDKFPLVTYAENELPLRAPILREENVLYIFTTQDDARSGRPSFNPACLKWQTVLKFSGVPFTTVSSSNHASPTGALPFLLQGTGESEQSKAQEPVGSNKLRKWLSSSSRVENVEELEDIRYEAYASLLDSRIRKAWLYQLYLSPANSSVARKLYVRPCSSSPIVQMTISYQLRRAAESELIKASASSTISELDILREAGEALEALSALLGQDMWFFGSQRPSLFDASVFAYTHLILDNGMQWQENKLAEQLKELGNLVQHQERILEMYF